MFDPSHMIQLQDVQLEDGLVILDIFMFTLIPILFLLQFNHGKLSNIIMVWNYLSLN